MVRRNVPDLWTWRNNRRRRIRKQHVSRFAAGNLQGSAGLYSASTIQRNGRDGSLGYVFADDAGRGRAWNVPLSEHQGTGRPIRADRVAY